MINFGDDKEFIENYQRLKSSRKMATLYNCSRNSITSHAKKIGYDYSKNKERKITSIPLDEVIAAYEELQSANRVGERYSCSGTSVRKYLINNGYELQRFDNKLTVIPDDEFINIYNQLKSAEKVGEYFHCSGTAVLNHAKKIGYDVNSCKAYKLSAQDKEQIIAAYNKMTSTELAAQYQVSRGMITRLWYDAGLCNKTNQEIKTTTIDLTGKTFGLWTVLYKSDKRDAGGNVYWHCKCSCGVERDVISASLRNGLSISCGAHNISKGNEKIKELLTSANIPFEAEKKFPTCKYINLLSFDFYVNNKYLIEFDGIQHYQSDHFFAHDSFETRKIRDNIKTNWCQENHIPLIRIPYTHLDQLTIQDLQLETSSFITVMPT